MPILKIENLSKRYGDRVVFEGLNREFRPGCHALSEEDNTGKTTLLNLIAGVLKPDTGDICVDGHSLRKSPKEAKLRMAFVPDDCMGFPQLTGRELLQRLAQEKKTRLDDAVLEFAHALGLEPHLDKRFEQMSTGTRRKVYLTAMEIGEPTVIVADGPTNGLDTAARAVLMDYFREIAREKVVLFASYDRALIEGCGAAELTVSGVSS